MVRLEADPKVWLRLQLKSSAPGLGNNFANSPNKFLFLYFRHKYDAVAVKVLKHSAKETLVEKLASAPSSSSSGLYT